MIILVILFGWITHISVIIQLVGSCLFAAALVMNHGRTRYLSSLVGIGLLAVGSAWEIIIGWQAGYVTALSIPFVLLPLTVFVSVLRSWQVYFPRTAR